MLTESEFEKSLSRQPESKTDEADYAVINHSENEEQIIGIIYTNTAGEKFYGYPITTYDMEETNYVYTDEYRWLDNSRHEVNNPIDEKYIKRKAKEWEFDDWYEVVSAD